MLIPAAINVKLTEHVGEIIFCLMVKFHEDSLTTEGDKYKIVIADEIVKSTKVAITVDLSNTRNT